MCYFEITILAEFYKLNLKLNCLKYAIFFFLPLATLSPLASLNKFSRANKGNIKFSTYFTVGCNGLPRVFVLNLLTEFN
jgi:hypothetical protein